MKRSLALLVVIAFVLLTSCKENKTSNQTIKGTVVKIIDGDTYDLKTSAHNIIRIKMEGIDAPEKGMPFYKESKKFLKEMCFGKEVTFKPNGLAKFEKMVGFTYLNNDMELSHEMLKAGMAWYTKKMNDDKDLFGLENEARLEGKGLWSQQKPIEPHSIRKARRGGIPLKYIQNI